MQSSSRTAPSLGAPLRHAGARDPSTFTECYSRYANDVHRWSRRLGGSWVEPDDVVQEVFSVVHRRLPDWEGDGNLGTWLFRITHHVVRNASRKRRLATMLGLAPRAVDFDDDDFDLRSTDPNAFHALEAKQTAAEVQSVLDRLSERHRTVIALFELEELSTAEIAELLDQKVGTIRVWLHRARQEFLRHYQALQSQQFRNGGPL